MGCSGAAGPSVRQEDDVTLVVFNCSLPAPVKRPPESMWMWREPGDSEEEDGERKMHLLLSKAQPGVVWKRAFDGHEGVSDAEAMSVCILSYVGAWVMGDDAIKSKEKKKIVVRWERMEMGGC